VFPQLGSTDIPFSSYPLKAKYVELMGKDKGYNSSHVYCQVKGWSKKSYEIFSNDFGKGFWNGMMEGEKMDSRKTILKLKCFSPLEILTSHFYLERLLELFFFLSFLVLFSLSLFIFNAPSLWGLGDFDDKQGENTLQKFLFRWNGMEWLNHDYEDGGVVDISVVDAYSRMELCMPILLGEARKKIWMANHFQNQHKQEFLCG
jgi:hypothetical protein